MIFEFSDHMTISREAWQSADCADAAHCVAGAYMQNPRSHYKASWDPSAMLTVSPLDSPVCTGVALDEVNTCDYLLTSQLEDIHAPIPQLLRQFYTDTVAQDS